jgi:hypothetical protein
VAYWFGWWVNHEGTSIWSYDVPGVPDGGRDYTGMRCQVWAYTTQARACVSHAGWLAETILRPDLSTREDEELARQIDELQWQDEADDPDDAHDTLRALIEANPHMSAQDLLGEYRRYETETLAILNRPEVWQSIERVAHALLAKGRLTGDEVEACLADGVRYGAFSPLGGV